MNIKTLKTAIFIIITVLIFIVILFPPFILFFTSIKTESEALSFPPVWIFTPTLENYREAVQKTPIENYLLNSLIVASSNTGIVLFLGSLAGYALARFKFKGAENISFWILSIRMMPPVAAIIPLYIIMKNLRLLDNPLSLIITYLTFNLPFAVWMMKGFFQEIPKEIEESALVDGCSTFGTFWKIAMPLVAPGLVATGILTFIFAWNEFLFALILTGSKAVTLPVGITSYIKETGIGWGYMTAGGVLALIPVIVFTILAQKHLVKGLTMGALK